MIKAENITKMFGDKKALNLLSCEIPEGCIFGMVGANGAGKSTLLRLLTGVYSPDSGSVTMDGKIIYSSPDVKAKLSFVPDELYFLQNANMKRMAKLYQCSFKDFDTGRMEKLASIFGLSTKANINTFSKGMKRQAATILALSCRTKYIFLDETLDGLDPIVRNLVKKVLYDDICERGATAVITSHSLRELEDTCDQLALLHEGGIVFQSDIQDLKTSLFKVQVAFGYEFDSKLFEGIDVKNYSQNGSVANLVVGGDKDEVQVCLRGKNPMLLEILPLSLEEVFVHEMEALGYAFEGVLELEEGVAK